MHIPPAPGAPRWIQIKIVETSRSGMKMRVQGGGVRPSVMRRGVVLRHVYELTGHHNIAFVGVGGVGGVVGVRRRAIWPISLYSEQPRPPHSRPRLSAPNTNAPEVRVLVHVGGVAVVREGALARW